MTFNTKIRTGQFPMNNFCGEIIVLINVVDTLKSIKNRQVILTNNVGPTEPVAGWSAKVQPILSKQFV